MSGSVAEERIRAKVVDEMRRRYPDARIIHELVLEQGGIRIDVAAVTPDRLVVAEVKSERDVLKRLKSQVERALMVAQEVWVVVAKKHVPALDLMQSHYVTVPLPEPIERYGRVETTEQITNPDRFHKLGSCWLLREGDTDELQRLSRWDLSPPSRALIAPAHMLEMLWADELRWLTADLGSHPRTCRTTAIHMAVEQLSGREIRRRTCALLRSRAFPRADEPASLPTLNTLARAAA